MLSLLAFAPLDDRFAKPVVKGKITNNDLTETSGIAVSLKNKGMLWAHNDSGDLPKLYLLDTTGQVRKVFSLEKATHIDWEDIALHYDSTTQKSYLYIGDIGDNFSLMPFRTIYKIEEPSIDEPVQITGVQKMIFKYPDGARDAETLLVSPVDGSIIIVTKREQKVHVYKLAFKPFRTEQDTIKPELMGKLNFNNIVGGDINPDGRSLLLKTYKHVYLWDLTENGIASIMNQSPSRIKSYIEEPQGESICWDVLGEGFFTLSEKKGKLDPVLYYYPALD